jgi:hypothetical protein
MHARVPSEGERSFFSLCRERTWGGGERSGGRTETRAEERRGAEGRRGSSARNLKWDPSLMMIWICRAALRLFVCPSSRSTCFAEKSRIAAAGGAVRARGKFRFWATRGAVGAPFPVGIEEGKGSRRGSRRDAPRETQPSPRRARPFAAIVPRSAPLDARSSRRARCREGEKPRPRACVNPLPDARAARRGVIGRDAGHVSAESVDGRRPAKTGGPDVPSRTQRAAQEQEGDVR